MQFGGQGKPSVGVIFDADLGNTIDDALALALLYGLQGKNESRVVSVSVTYLIVDPGRNERVLAAYTELASGKAVGRPQGFRPPEKKKQ